MRVPKFVFLFFLVASYSSNFQAQARFSHEIGAFAGGVAFQSDFGQRYDFATNSGNVGYGVGLVHYLNFSYTEACPSCVGLRHMYIREHFKVRSEFSYNSTNLQHYGKWVDESKTSVAANQLRAMKGFTKVMDLGMQIEYYPWNIEDFSSTIGSFGPFIALGGHYSSFDNGTYSELGPLNLDYTTPGKYMNATSSEGGNTWSIVSSVGTRYKLTLMSDLFLELRWQYYFTDWVDGLKPDPQVWTENIANDWNLWLHVGYIYYLD